MDMKKCSMDGNRIVQKVLDEFNKIKVGKPTVRSNGVGEWTVLAGIVAIIEAIPENHEKGILEKLKEDKVHRKLKEDDTEEILICLATGVKALPNKVRLYSNGLFVHDMHAEMLCLRLFNWYLIDECVKLNENKESLLFERNVPSPLEGHSQIQYKLKDGIKLALFISEPPCGDASMSLVQDNGVEWENYQVDDNKRRKVTRGREHFSQVGIVRTKPGRSDSSITYTKSCSDKLCLKQLLGINNSLTSVLCQPIYLDYLVIEESKYEKSDFRRCFQERFTDKFLDPHSLQIITFNNSTYPFHKPIDKNIVPSPLSLLYVVPKKKVQVLNNGVKNGSFIKNKPPKRGGESFVCNQRMYESLARVLAINESSYEEFKRSHHHREELKSKGKAILGNWTSGDKDDFELS